MNRPTIAKQTKARIQPKPNKQTAKSAESIYAIKRKNKRLIADLQSKYQNSRNSERYCTQGDNVWPRGHDINTISQCYRCAND